MAKETPFDRLRRLGRRLRTKARIFSIRRSRLKDRSNPLEHYNTLQFKNRYHMSKDTTVFIANLISFDLTSPLRRGCQLPPILQFLSVLRFYCTGSFQLVIGDYSQMTQSTVSRLVKRVSILIAKLRPRFIRFPSKNDTTKVTRMREEFYRIAGFPGVVGAVDGCQIRTESVGGENAELFRNKDGYFSFNVQGICNATLNFTNIVAKWYGSCHDSRMFENSVVGMDLENGTLPGILLGDSGYPLTPYVMTPILAPATPAEQRYNYSQIRTRGTIERTFGIWKRRFPCLKHLRTKLSTSLAIIISTAVLHNISRQRNDLYQEEFIQTIVNADDDGPGLVSTNGKAARLAIINSHFL